jgi:hypothetical protein
LKKASTNQDRQNTGGLLSADSDRPEIFVLSDPPDFPNTRTVHPPRPDASGRFLVSEVMDWFDLMNQVQYHCWLGRRFFRAHMASMAPQDAVQAMECLHQLERIMPIFNRRHLGLIPEQQRLKDVCICLLSELILCTCDAEAVQLLSHHIAGSAGKWEFFGRALVENRLFSQKDWRQAKSPAKWLKTVTNKLADSEYWVCNHAVDPSENVNKVSLEEIAELPGEAIFERKYTHRSVAELEAAVKDDPDVAAYLAAKIRFPAWRREAIWRHLEWRKEFGERVDRRYRRARNLIREMGAGIQCRDYSPGTGVSDANCTTYFEPILNGSLGSKTGVWQHRNPDRDEG